MSKADDKFLKLARERFKQAEEAEKAQRERERADLRFYAGEQWDADLLDARKGQTIGSGTSVQIVPARPSLTINKTREPVRQILNEERKSELAIELTPADDWGDTTGPIDHHEIELREGLVRRIQRDSEAAGARTWAFARSTIAGRGYWLVLTRFMPGKSWNQEVYVDRIYNQGSVLLDPSREQPDGSDAEWGFYGTTMPWDTYKSEFPASAKNPNRVSSASDDDWRILGEEAPDWFTSDGDTRSVRVMNYYYTERESRELAQGPDGQGIWLDEWPEHLPKPKDLQTRTVVTKKIKWAKIDGCQVIDETDWPGRWLPIIETVGEELPPYDKDKRCEGVVRPMLDACKGNNYIISKFVERVGLTPIPPWMMAGGQDEGYEDEYNTANTRALSRLHYNQKDNFEQQAPPPFKPDNRADIADIGMGVQLFGQAIASTSVVPETALGNADPTVKSGKLAKLLLDQATRGTSNFLDNLTRSMRHEARVINDLLSPIYGRPGRLARMITGQGEMASVVIGQPFTTQGDGKQARPMPVKGWQPGQPTPEGAKLYTLTPDCDFNVAVTIKKSEGTRREEIAEKLTSLIEADPTQMGIIGDKLWKNLDVPDHEEFEERYRAILIPPIQALLNKQQPVPPQAQAQIAQLTQQLQQVMPLADKNKTDLQKATIQRDENIQIAQMNNETRVKVAWITASAGLAKATADVDAENARTVVDSLDTGAAAELDLHMKKLETVHAVLAQSQDHLHEAALQADQQAHELTAAEQAHQQALEQQSQQAALTPVPTETP